MFLAHEVGDALVIDEMHLVLRRDAPFCRRPSLQKRLNVVEPEFGDAVEVRPMLIAGDLDAVTLYKASQIRNTSAYWTMNVLPISKEVIVRHPGLLRNAIDNLDHFFQSTMNSVAPSGV